MITVTPVLFYVFATLLTFFAYQVVTTPNPIHSALYLVLTMMGLAATYFNLNAQFIAGVQLIVYAGAVMVLFVMVLMLFDLQVEAATFSKGFFSGLFKVVGASVILGNLIGIFTDGSNSNSALDSAATLANQADVTKSLATMLYTKYLLAFEVLGVLLLVVAVGAVAVSRVRGGTHGQH